MSKKSKNIKHKLDSYSVTLDSNWGSIAMHHSIGNLSSFCTEIRGKYLQEYQEKSGSDLKPLIDRMNEPEIVKVTKRIYKDMCTVENFISKSITN